MTSPESVTIQVVVKDVATAELDKIGSSLTGVGAKATTAATEADAALARMDKALGGVGTSASTAGSGVDRAVNGMTGSLDRLGTAGTIAGDRMAAGLESGVAKADVAAAMGTAGAKVETAAAGAGKRAGASMGNAMMTGFLAVGIATMVGKYISGAVTTATTLASSAVATSRVTGGTVTDSSRLNTELQLSGIDPTKGSKALVLLSKNLGTAATSAKKAAAETALLGFSWQDANGKALPLTQLLPKLEDKFASMPNGAEKTALAMKLFGRSGADLLPFLNRGAAGIAELGKKSDELGLTVNDSMVKNMAAAKMESREFDAAMEGLKVTIGTALLPIMTSLRQFMSSYLIPAFQGMSVFIKDNITWLGPLTIGLGTLFAALKVGRLVVDSFNKVMEANPVVKVITVLYLLAIAVKYAYDHFQWFHDMVLKVWVWLQATFQSTMVWLRPILKWIGDNIHVVGDAFNWLWNNAIHPAFNAIATGAAWLWKTILLPYFTLEVNGVKTVAAIWVWLWTNAIQPAIGWIAPKIVWLWQTIILPTFTLIVNIVKVVGAILLWLWTNIVAPVAAWIGGKIVWLWQNVMMPYFTLIVNIVKFVGSVYLWLWTNIVLPVFTWIAGKVIWLWQTIISPTFTFIVNAVKNVGAEFSWFWNSIILPVFNWVGAKVTWLWKNIINPLFNQIMAMVRSAGAVFSWFWTNVISPVFNWIAAKVVWLWQTFVMPYFNLIAAIIRTVAGVLVWFWTSVVLPVFNWVGAKVKWVWTSIIMPIFNAIAAIVRAVGAVFQWFWNSIIQPVWTWIQSKITAVWGFIQDHVFTPLKAGITTVGGVFVTLRNTAGQVWDWIWNKISTVWGFISGIWDKLKEFAGAVGAFFTGIWKGVEAAVGKIVGFIKNIVDAIKGFFTDTNPLTGGVGGNGAIQGGILNPGGLPGSARGSVVPGTDPGRRDNRIMAVRSEESIFVPEFTRAIGGEPTVHAWNRAAEAGRLGDYLPGMATGGVVGGTAGTAASPAGVRAEGILVAQSEKVLGLAVDKIMASRGGGGSYAAGNVAGARGKFLDAVASKMGTQYVWGAAGPNVFDCSGLMSWALDQAGVGVGRLTAQDFNAQFPHIPQSSVVPGDLVTFDTGRLPGQAGHIGAVMDVAKGLMMNTDGSGPAGIADYLRRDGGPLSFIDPIGGKYTLKTAATPGGDPPSGGSSSSWLAGILSQITNAGKVSASGGAPGASTAGVEQWRTLGLSALALTGQPASFINQLLMQMNSESSGNKAAINNWDSNAARGTPSEGLMQVIQPTFSAMQAFSSIALNNIWDPLQNMVAGILWEVHNTGSLANWQGKPYDTGGMWPSGTGGVNNSGQREAVLTGAEAAAYKAHAASLASGSGGRTVTIAPGAMVFNIGSASAADRAALQAQFEKSLRLVLQENKDRSF